MTYSNRKLHRRLLLVIAVLLPALIMVASLNREPQITTPTARTSGR